MVPGSAPAVIQKSSQVKKMSTYLHELFSQMQNHTYFYYMNNIPMPSSSYLNMGFGFCGKTCANAAGTVSANLSTYDNLDKKK